jgi:hypothetical protein
LNRFVPVHGVDSITIDVTRDAFRMHGKTLVLGFDFQGTGQSPLDPGLIQITPSHGAKVLSQVHTSSPGGGDESVVLVQVRPSRYVIQVSGASGTGGSYRLDAYLAGDASGDFNVNRQDLRTIRSHFGARLNQPGYLASADVDGDGTIGRRDRSLARKNLGGSTTVRPLGLSASVDPTSDPTGHSLVTRSDITIAGQTEAGATVGLRQGNPGEFSQVTSADLSGSFQFAVNVGVGVTPFQIVASDLFGQQAEFDLTVTRATVASPPVVSLRGPNPNQVSSTNVTVTGNVTSGSSAVTSLQAQVDSGPLVNVTFDSSGQFVLTT